MSKKASDIKDVYAVFGADAFRKREAVQAICHAIMEGGGGQDGPTRLDGAEVDLATVLDEVRTYSLLGGRRIVVVEEADPLITRHRQALERYCAAPVDSGTLILVCNSLPANTRLYKTIVKTGLVIKCVPLKGKALIDWVAQRCAAEYGKELDSRAAWLLRETVGTSLGALDAELNKLSTYVRDRNQISAADVEALVGQHREADIFGITDAMASGNTAQALARWERVLATDRAAPARAIGGLAWGIRRLLDLKTQADAGVPVYTLARQAYTQPEVLERRLQQVTIGGLQQQLSDLLEVDLASKTGLATVPSAVEKFIVQHSAGRSTSGRTA